MCKKLNIFCLTLAVVAALVLALAPAAQALTLIDCDNPSWSMELDTLAYGAILRPPDETGRWADERGPGALKSTLLPTRDGDGSMMIDYGYWADPYPPPPPGDPYDRVPRGYFEMNPDHPEYAPALPDLTGLCFTFSWWKGNANGPEHVREIQIYSPNGMARFAVANGGEAAVGDIHYTGMLAGWQDVTTAPVGSSGWTYEGTFDPTNVTTIDFWVSCWHQEWVENPPGNWYPIEEQLMPTGTPVYIDEVHECGFGADITGDGFVDYKDLKIMADEWLTSGIYADLTDDDYINIKDYSKWAVAWHQTEPYYYTYCNCKIWDAAIGISGAIDVANARICQSTFHSALSIADFDHWVDLRGKSGYPEDTIMYSWDKAPGTNSDSGRWTNGTTGPIVGWQAPPCTGTVFIMLIADDAPDPMYNACPGAMTRDDNPIATSGISTVSLPIGCFAGIKSAELTANKTGTPDCSNPNWPGSTGPPTNPITNILARYSNCKWVFEVTASEDCPCGVCPGNFTQIDNGNDPDVNESNFSTFVNGFYNGGSGNGGGDCFKIADGTIYGNSDCIQAHEDKHFSMFTDYLLAEKALLLNNTSMDDMIIDCDDSTTTTCQAAAAARQAAIEADVATAYYNAWFLMVGDGQTEPQQAEFPCAENLAKSICQRAKDEPTWDVDTCAQCVAWGYTD